MGVQISPDPQQQRHSGRTGCLYWKAVGNKFKNEGDTQEIRG